MPVKPGLERKRVPPKTTSKAPTPHGGIPILRELSDGELNSVYEGIDNPFVVLLQREIERSITNLAIGNLQNDKTNHDENRGMYKGLMAVGNLIVQVKNERKRRIDRDSASNTPGQ